MQTSYAFYAHKGSLRVVRRERAKRLNASAIVERPFVERVSTAGLLKRCRVSCDEGSEWRSLFFSSRLFLHPSSSLARRRPPRMPPSRQHPLPMPPPGAPSYPPMSNAPPSVPVRRQAGLPRVRNIAPEGVCPTLTPLLSSRNFLRTQLRSERRHGLSQWSRSPTTRPSRLTQQTPSRLRPRSRR